jgi:hypothetical protein
VLLPRRSETSASHGAVDAESVGIDRLCPVRQRGNRTVSRGRTGGPYRSSSGGGTPGRARRRDHVFDLRAAPVDALQVSSRLKRRRSSVGIDARFTLEDLGAVLDTRGRSSLVGRAGGWVRGGGGEALIELLASAKGGI